MIDVPVTVLNEEMERWKRTPFMKGQCAIDLGIDCVRLAYNVGWGTFLKSRSLPRRLRWNTPQDAFVSIREIRKVFLQKPIQYHKRQAGDVAVSRTWPRSLHAGILGSRDEIWEVKQSGCPALWPLPREDEGITIYRSSEISFTGGNP